MKRNVEDNEQHQEQDHQDQSFQQQQFNMTISSSREGISQRDYLHKMATETREELQITDYQFNPIRQGQTKNTKDLQEYSPPMESLPVHPHETGYMVLRANTCKNQLRKWQERKIKHEYSMIEKEILKQILQDEYTLEQKQFWIQRDKQKSPSQICQKHFPHYQSPQQQYESPQKHTISSLSPVSNKGTLPQFNATVLSFGNNSRQKFPRAHSLHSKVVSSSRSINKNAQTIDFEQTKSSQGFKETETRNGQESQRKRSSQAESRLKQQINSPSDNSKSRKLNNPLSQSYFVDSIEYSSPYQRTSSKESQQRYQMQRNSSKEMKQDNLNIITPKEIREDFVFQNPHSKFIIMKTFNQMNKDEPRVRSPKISYNSQQFSEKLIFQHKTIEQYKPSPRKTTIDQTKQGSCYRFCEPLPITDPASVQKQAKKVIQERRRNYCLNQHFRIKIDKLISDEEFSERERKANISNLVRRKVHNNNTLSTNLKLQSSFIAANDQFNSSSPISQSLLI